jgi:hypothetical protein
VDTRTVVDFQEPGLHRSVYHDIEPEYLETHVSFEIAGLTAPVGVVQQRLHCTHRTHDQMIYTLLKQIHVLPFFRQQAQNWLVRSFMSWFLVIWHRIQLVVIVLFVNCVVSQMHVQIIQILLTHLLVRVSRESSHSL